MIASYTESQEVLCLRVFLTLLATRGKHRGSSTVDHLVDDRRSLGRPLLDRHRPVRDDVLAHHMLDVLYIAPVLGITVLQPNKRSTNIRRTMLHVVNNNWLLRTSRHEDLDGVVTVTIGTLIERALNALVCCVLSNPYGFRKFGVNIHPQSDRGNSNLKRISQISVSRAQFRQRFCELNVLRFVFCRPHFIEGLHKRPSEQATFYGMEKNPTTIRLAKMNLAVHGLEGKIDKAITYYEDPHELVGKADFVMANPPFNVDEIDADKIRQDPRLPYQLPGVNKQGKVGNGNYVWISYFDAYLDDSGRAGFVMSSQASSAGGEEARVRRDLIKSGHVDAMIAIRGNFFYTRTVPCELWFLNKGKPKEHRDKVLMIDARGVYRKVTRKIYDFSPEQLKNLTSIVWLYRGQSERFVALVAEHLENSVLAGRNSVAPVEAFVEALAKVTEDIASFFAASKDERARAAFTELKSVADTLRSDAQNFSTLVGSNEKTWSKAKRDNKELKSVAAMISKGADASHDLIRQIDHLAKLVARCVDLAEEELDSKESENWSSREIKVVAKILEETRQAAVEQPKLVRYFYRHAHWLQERFPEAKLCDVEGLVKLVSHAELEKNDWSLTPNRYVGIAPEKEDEDFDFEETLREIHVELSDLNTEATELAAKIAKNFEELGI
jgi:type I restriction enzyme M protein